MPDDADDRCLSEYAVRARRARAGYRVELLADNTPVASGHGLHLFVRAAPRMQRDGRVSLLGGTVTRLALSLLLACASPRPITRMPIGRSHMLQRVPLSVWGIEITDRDVCESSWVRPSVCCRNSNYGPAYDGCHWQCQIE